MLELLRMALSFDLKPLKVPQAREKPARHHQSFWSTAIPCAYRRAGLNTTPIRGFSPGLSGPCCKKEKKGQNPATKGFKKPKEEL